MSKELKREIQYKLSFNYMQYLNHARSKSNWERVNTNYFEKLKIKTKQLENGR
jgi:hypothetical protein